jgi:membrane protease subunit (stomatin/prohibitin family)
MLELITVNKLELAAELAHQKLEDNWKDSIQICKFNEDTITYTDEAQDIFNGYYDEYVSLLESYKI